MLCKRQPISFLLLMTIHWIIGVGSTNTTATPSGNSTAVPNVTTPLLAVSNVTSTQNAATLLPAAHNTTATGNITTPHPPKLNATSLPRITPTAGPVNVTYVTHNVTARLVNVTHVTHNVTYVTHNVTTRHDVAVHRDNVTGPAVNQTRFMPTARRDNFTVVPTPGMARFNMTRKPHNATQAPYTPPMVMNMTAGPSVNQTRVMPTNSWHLFTMPPNRTSLPPHANATVAVTQPPTTKYNTEPTTTVGVFPSCNTTCHRYASCVAGGSGKSCVCNAGYSGDGTTCTLASKKVNLEMRMTSIPFTEDLKDRNSQAFRSLSFKVSKQIFDYLKTTSLGSSLLSVTILNFRQGSVVANYNANFQSNATVSDSGVSSALQQAISKDPNNTFGIDVSSLCTKTDENAACGETTGMNQYLLIGLGAGVPVVAIIMLTLLGCLIKRALNRKKGDGDSEAESWSEEESEEEIEEKKKDKKVENGEKERVDKKNDKKVENGGHVKKDKNDKKTVSKDTKNSKKEINGGPQKKVPSPSYPVKPDPVDPQRNYKRMTFQPAVKSGRLADKYEHDLGGIYFPRRYKVPEVPKPSFHYVEGHVQGKPVTVVVPI
ncbi:PREDICTED: uncharacterized protein LOC109474663 isoform X2 [Branchiostoma belcheri]|uniref:Uncharacterized protein LOC109474663 isoform X2 n=1 Tax=Branchiostoma belcheri TaxID=7741 RepID=A0A6P4ZHK2_BRABE|nr:PREDICTED: uncharacterized protein LOC109474663 isoform X2 [Branchiostoma belcheri]